MRSRAGFQRLTDIEQLAAAFALTVRGKRRRPDVAWMVLQRPSVLARLRAALLNGTWRPHGFDLLRIHDPKPRIIARASPEDRVVHNAVVAVLEDQWRSRLAPEDFACRRGFGTHRAVLALQRAMQRHRFALHLDVRAYFPSIDLDRLRALLAPRIRDREFMEVVDRILESGRGLYRTPTLRRFARLTPEWPPPDRGLPIGAATSQFFAAHVYLCDFDHWLKRTLKVPACVRYVDDFFLFGETRADLRTWRAAVAEWLGEHRGLRLKHPEARILSCAGHLDGLGHRITRSDRVVLPRASRNLTRRVAALMRDEPGPDLERSLAASIGVLTF